MFSKSLRKLPIRKARSMTMIVILLVLTSMALAGSHTSHKSVSTDCDIQAGSCTKTIEDLNIRLNIGPKPVTAMQELTFTLTLSPKPDGDPTPLYIDLGMPGMQMGPNRVTLKAVQPGIFEGKGIIVRCPSGKRVWRATVVHGDQKTEFTFDVVY